MGRRVVHLPRPTLRRFRGSAVVGSKSWRGGQLQPQLLPRAFQPCGSLEPRRDWPRASPEWKCTSEKDPAGDPGEGSLPSLKQVPPSVPLLSRAMSKLCEQRGRGMLERSAEDCGGGCICGLPGNKCTQKVGGAVAGRSPTMGGYVGVLCYVGFLTVWCGSWDVVPVCMMCLCVWDACAYVHVCVHAHARTQAPVRGCPRVSLRFCWEWREGRLGATQGPLDTESVSVEEGDRREDENAEREGRNGGLGWGPRGRGTMRAEGMRGRAWWDEGEERRGPLQAGLRDPAWPPAGSPPPALGGPDTPTPAPVLCTLDSISSAPG